MSIRYTMLPSSEKTKMQQLLHHPGQGVPLTPSCEIEEVCVTPSECLTKPWEWLDCEPCRPRQKDRESYLPGWDKDVCNAAETGGSESFMEAMCFTPVGHTSLITALRTPVIPELNCLQAPRDFDRLSLQPGHDRGTVEPIRPSLRPRAQVRRPFAIRVRRPVPNKREQDRNLTALINGIPKMPDSRSLEGGMRGKLKPRTLL